MEPLKIGILGEIRAGKDTVARIIIQELDTGSSEFAFSAGIHRIIKTYLPELYEQGKPREALQEIGQLFRKYDPDVWVTQLFESLNYELAVAYEHSIIVTDVRQPNEAIRLKEEGFIILKVTADKEIRAGRAAKEGDNFTADMFNHETEIAVNSCEYDYEIDNSGDYDRLRSKVKEFLKYAENRGSTIDEREVSEGNKRAL